MKVTKLGHCAMIIEIKTPQGGTLTILTDPGSFSVDAQKDLTNIDVILITHEHQDHFHVESLKSVLEHNPGAVIITNKRVAGLVQEQGIGTVVQMVNGGEVTAVNGVSIEGHGNTHAEIYKELPPVENTGYLVAGGFYFPGDAFHNPGKAVDVLALPVAGPWMKISDAINFVREVAPKRAFPVHDGMYNQYFVSFAARVLPQFLPTGTEFVDLKAGETKEF